MIWSKCRNWFEEVGFLCTCRRPELESSSLHLFKFLRASFEVGGDVAGELGKLGQVGDEVVVADCEAGAPLLAEQGVGKDRGRCMCLVDGGVVSDLQAVVDCNKHNARRAVAAALGDESAGLFRSLAHSMHPPPWIHMCPQPGRT